MQISDWITLAAVFVALGLGLSSLIQTQSLQKRERKERLLNEIIGWAMEATRSKFEGAFQELGKLGKSDKKSYEVLAKAQLHEIRIMYSNLLPKSAYIGNIAKSFDLDMEKNLNTAFAAILTLQKILNELAEVYGQKPHAEIDEYFELLQEHDDKLVESANMVMDKASKLKARI